jgi:uncharacterized Fe-S cluster protein YjdI
MDKIYSAKDIVVHFDARLCIHAAECVRGLPSVFDPAKKPWIDPTQSAAQDIAKVIERCPSGALRYERLDGGSAEVPSEPEISLVKDGPIYLRGNLKLTDDGGNAIYEGARMALCRCGQSKNKPFCDLSHTLGFEVAPVTVTLK